MEWVKKWQDKLIGGATCVSLPLQLWLRISKLSSSLELHDLGRHAEASAHEPRLLPRRPRSAPRGRLCPRSRRLWPLGRRPQGLVCRLKGEHVCQSVASRVFAYEEIAHMHSFGTQVPTFFGCTCSLYLVFSSPSDFLVIFTFNVYLQLYS